MYNVCKLKANKNLIFEKIKKPTIITIFGITGDLAKRKLISSLYQLGKKDLLPDRLKIIGFSHTDITSEGQDGDDAIREYVSNILIENGHSVDEDMFQKFVQCFHYQKGSFTNKQDFQELGDHINRIEERFGQCSNKLMYFAVPPRFYEQILEKLDKVDLNKPCGDHEGWVRLLIEKPFGSDIDSAKELDCYLAETFDEEQIFRIDHYLEKAMVQNILTFRFSNSLFEPVWNKEGIKKIKVQLHEDLGVENRGSFYDDIGTLRDVGKNHALQLLAMATMDNPKNLEADNIREKREEIFNDLHCMSEDEVVENTTRGQYEGYLDVEGVKENSDTETFFRLETYIDNDRWEGVPIIIEAGKELHGKHASIEVEFEPSQFALCPPGEKCDHSNIVEFRIQPNHEIRINFVARKPRFKYELEEEEFVFSQDAEDSEIPEAYQKVLYDCLRGDQTMFASTQEVDTAWEFVMPILRAWEQGKPDLQKYSKGVDPDDI